MAYTTDEYWDIDGVSLNQDGWNIATVGGERYDLPVRRGENIALAYRPGTLHRQKLPEQRVISLSMWTAGIDNVSGYGSDPVLQWNDNWDTLRRLVWKPNGAQVTLTRRWKLTVASTPTIVAASALAEVSEAMTPSMTGRARSEFQMTFLLADPYFYGTQVTTPIPLSTPTVVTNAGHDAAAHAWMQVDLIGPLTNPKLTNATPTPDVWVAYTGSIAAGQTVTLDVGACTATCAVAPTNRINLISHSGSRYWMGLLAGTNTLTLTASAGTGSAVVRFKPPYV